MSTAPILATWDGDNFQPLRRFRKTCDALFIIGCRYRVQIEEERSAKSHAHFFATLHDLWLSLPDDQAERFQSVEALRKYALIKGGFADSRQFVAASKAEAQRLAAFIRPCDEYALIQVREATVTVWTAQSQSRKAMGAKDFQRSKEAVLEYASSLIGVSPSQLERERAA